MWNAEALRDPFCAVLKYFHISHQFQHKLTLIDFLAIGKQLENHLKSNENQRGSNWLSDAIRKILSFSSA